MYSTLAHTGVSVLIYGGLAAAAIVAGTAAKLRPVISRIRRRR